MIFGFINLPLLNLISRITRHIRIKIRMLIIFLCFLIITLIFSLIPRSELDNQRMIVISCIVLVLTVMCAEGEMRAVSWYKPQMLSLESLAIIMVIVSFLHPVGQGFLIFALDILFLFPMLYTALLNRKDMSQIMDLLSYAIIVSGILSFAFGILLAQGGGNYVVFGRVAGGVKNPNYYGMIGLAVVMSGMYNVARNKGNLRCIIITSICTGIGLSMIAESVSRTAMLAAFACAAVAFVYSVRVYCERRDNKIPRAFSNKKRVLITVFVVILTIMSAFAFIKLHYVVYLSAPEGSTEAAYFFHNISIIQEAYASDGDEDQPEELVDIVEERLSIDAGLDTFSSGRISIWEKYIEHFNLEGNDLDAAKERGEFDGLMEYRAHNNIIEYMYRFGVPAGCLYVVFFIAILFRAAIISFRKTPFTAFDMWVVLTVSAYAVYAMLEIATLPFTRYFPCLLFLSAAPIMGKLEAKQE